jgi:hypothetical protein
MMADIPGSELNSLLTAVAEAGDLAAEGKVAEGYTRLLEGLHYVEAAGAAREAWGEEVMAAWRSAMDHYAERFGVARE